MGNEVSLVTSDWHSLSGEGTLSKKGADKTKMVRNKQQRRN